MLPALCRSRRVLHLPLPTSTVVPARRYVYRKAPKVEARERSRLRNGPSIAVSNLDWPKERLAELVQQGFLTINTIPGMKKTIERSTITDTTELTVFLGTFVNWYNPSKNERQINTFLKDRSFEPPTLTILAMILTARKPVDRRHANTARDLLLAATKMDEGGAACLLFDEALRRGILGDPTLKEVVRVVERQVDKGNTTAMLLLASKHVQDGDVDKALDLAERAQMEAKNTYDFDPVLKEGPPKAWIIIARALKVKGDVAAQQAALETAAFDEDDPEAYYLLARDCIDPESRKYIEYMTKAAASGFVDSAVHVGRWHLLSVDQKDEGKPKSERLEQYAIAEEWFRCALEHPKVKRSTMSQYVQLNLLLCAAVREDIVVCREILSRHVQEDKNGKQLKDAIENDSRSSMISQAFATLIRKNIISWEAENRRSS